MGFLSFMSKKRETNIRARVRTISGESKREELLFNYPQFRKYPCGFLAAWFYRLFKNLIVKPGKTVGELRALRNDEEHQKVTACMREMGLEKKDEKI